MALTKTTKEYELKIAEQKSMIYAMKEVISALILKYGVSEDTQFRKKD